MSLRNLPPGYASALDPDDMPGLAEAAERLARMEGVRLMRGRELAAAVIHGGAVVAALWTEASSGVFTFDIAVAREHQRRKLGSALALYGRSLADDYLEAGYGLELLAISEGGASLAKRLGLVLTGSAPGVTIWRQPAAV